MHGCQDINSKCTNIYQKTTSRLSLMYDASICAGAVQDVCGFYSSTSHTSFHSINRIRLLLHHRISKQNRREATVSGNFHFAAPIASPPHFQPQARNVTYWSFVKPLAAYSAGFAVSFRADVGSSEDQEPSGRAYLCISRLKPRCIGILGRKDLPGIHNLAGFLGHR